MRKRKNESGLDFDTGAEEKDERIPQSPSKRPKSKSAAVQKSGGPPAPLNLKGKRLNILRAIVDAPSTMNDLRDRKVAGRTKLFADLPLLEGSKYIELGDDGLYHATPMGRDQVRPAEATPQRAPAPDRGAARGGTEEDKAAHRIAVTQKAKREIIKTEMDEEKLEIIRAKKPTDLDEELKAERLRKLRLANDKAENAEAERERRRKIKADRDAARRAAHEAAMNGVAMVVIHRYEPGTPETWEEWVTDGPEHFGVAAGDADVDSVYFRVADFVDARGGYRYQHRISLYSGSGLLLNADSANDIFPASEPEIDRLLRQSGERLRQVRKERRNEA